MSDDGENTISIPVRGPGPRPLPESLKTSVRIVGQRQIDDFTALCHLFGRRPHELAADFVFNGIRLAREDPDLATGMGILNDIRDEHRALEGGHQPPNVINLSDYRKTTR